MPIVKYVALLLGYLMEGIYKVLDVLHIPNIGMAIILFTLIMYVLMLPLQIKQQKFSKMNSIMAPELNKIREKYANTFNHYSFHYHPILRYDAVFPDEAKHSLFCRKRYPLR